MAKADIFRARVEQVVLAATELRTLAGVLQRVQSLTSNQESSSSELSRMISADTVLTAKVLKLVNSAQFGLDRRISNIDEAIVMAGYNNIKNLCASLMAAGMLKDKQGSKNFDHVSMWRHSLGMATIAHFLQEKYHPVEKCDLFTTGVLCNVGRLILNQRFTDEFDQALRLAKDRGISLLDAERDVFGVTHAEVGYWVAELWRFDEILAHTVRHHHGPSSTKPVDIINMAYVVTQALDIGSPGDPVLAHLMPGLFRRLDIDDIILDQLLTRFKQLYKGLEPVFLTVGK